MTHCRSGFHTSARAGKQRVVILGSGWGGKCPVQMPKKASLIELSLSVTGYEAVSLTRFAMYRPNPADSQ